jgi:hypothetical protein
MTLIHVLQEETGDYKRLCITSSPGEFTMSTIRVMSGWYSADTRGDTGVIPGWYCGGYLEKWTQNFVYDSRDCNWREWSTYTNKAVVEVDAKHARRSSWPGVQGGVDSRGDDSLGIGAAALVEVGHQLSFHW